MPDNTLQRVCAIHSHWSGFLILQTENSSVTHEGHNSSGTYEILGDTIVVHWDKFGSETFKNICGTYVHEEVIKKSPSIEKASIFTIGGMPVISRMMHVNIPGKNYEVALRLQTSDVPTFKQIFIKNEYESPNLPISAESIVDLGANIGLAAVFFGLKYPNAKILSVEPEKENFDSLVMNTAALGDRIQKCFAAVWIKDAFIDLRTKDLNGRSLGAWGVQVSDNTVDSVQKTACFKLATLLDKSGFPKVDILKIDIEGAELELFSQASSEWLSKIKLLIVETHDRFRPGSEDAVRKAVSSLFEEMPRSGENLFFRNKML